MASDLRATGETPALVQPPHDSPPTPEVRRAEPADAPPLADQIRNQVSEHLDDIQRSGRVQMQMDLQPPDLGRMRMHVALDDGNLHIRFVVQDDAVKQVLDQQMEPLRVRFAEMGVGLGQFDVRRDGGSPQQQPAPNYYDPTPAYPGAPRSDQTRREQAYAPLARSTGSIDVLA